MLLEEEAFEALVISKIKEALQLKFSLNPFIHTDMNTPNFTSAPYTHFHQLPNDTGLKLADELIIHVNANPSLTSFDGTLSYSAAQIRHDHTEILKLHESLRNAINKVNQLEAELAQLRGHN